MKSIIEWLGTVECRAHEVYDRAAVVFKGDAPLSAFLRDLASDELCHVEFMQAAAKVLDNVSPAEEPILLDKDTREQLEAPFRRTEEALAGDALTVDQLLDCIISTEFSEWNDIHLYVMNKLQERGPVFMRMAAAIEQHRKYIAEVLGTLPGGPDRLKPYRKLPHVWRERILIVDDAPPMTQLLSAVCRDLGSITVAGNGEEALRLVTEQYFDAVICDIDMPVMNGIDFFKKAVADDPFLRDRLIFFSGALSPSLIDFFHQQEVRYVEKPVGINRVKALVFDILQHSGKRFCPSSTAGATSPHTVEAFLAAMKGAKAEPGSAGSSPAHVAS